MRDSSIDCVLKPRGAVSKGSRPLKLLGHTGFVIRVCEYKEDVLKDRDEKLLEEHVGSLWIWFRHVVHKLNAHAQTRILDLTVVVFAGPHARIDDEFELSAIQSQQCLETMSIDGLEKPKKFDSMFRVLREVFVDHLKRTFEDVFHDRGDFIGHKALLKVSPTLTRPWSLALTEYFEVFLVQRTCSLEMIVVMTLRTSASRASGTFWL